jgi:hypothetical protein
VDRRPLSVENPYYIHLLALGPVDYRESRVDRQIGVHLPERGVIHNSHLLLPLLQNSNFKEERNLCEVSL